MTEPRRPDYQHWITMPLWSIQQAYLLLHGREPNDPNLDRRIWTEPDRPEYKTKQKIYAARRARDIVPKSKSGKSFRPEDLLRWASTSRVGISVPQELADLYDRHFAGSPDGDSEIPHGNVEVFAYQREQVLGAALAVLARFRGDASFKNGNPSGTKIVTLIEQNAAEIWSEDEDIPLEPQTMQKLINNWLRRLAEKD